MAGRTSMNLRLTPEARRGWDRLCRDTGVSLTALVEAIGLEFAEHTSIKPQPKVVERARQIDHERSTRRLPPRR